MAIPEAIHVEDGELLTAPGVYAMSIGWYHSDCCDGPSISSSGLRTMWSKSPAHYWVTSPLNPQRQPQPDNEAFNFGRAAHFLLLQGRQGFDEEFVVRPERWGDWRTDAAKAWRNEQIACGKTVITMPDLQNIVGMARSLAAHPVVRAGALDGLVERSLIWKDVETGVWLRARPDAIPTDDGIFSDLKTTTSVDDDSLMQSIGDFGYHAQGALVGEACRNVLNMEMQSFSLIFCEKAAPWCVRVVSLRPEDLDRGAQQNRAMTHKFADCLGRGVWPGPGDENDAEFMGLQPYLAARIDARLAVAIPELEAAKYLRQQEQA